MVGKEKDEVVENGHDDGAEEKMLRDEVKPVVTPVKDGAEVKFVSKNGDAKINIGKTESSLSGLSKEELMKFATDPFWVRLRWFIFIAFWVLWIAMLSGAIAIIVMAPKCPAPTVKKFWQQSPVVHFNQREISEKTLAGLTNLLDSLNKQNIKVVSLDPIIQYNHQGRVINFTNIDPRFGSKADFEKFVNTIKANGQHLILDLDLNHSGDDHEWFLKSINRTDPYTRYYVWGRGKKNDDGSLVPPTNWLNYYGGSAWKYNEKRGEFYLHQFNETEPDLNYNNANVTNEVKGILRFWMNLGVEGFRLWNTRYLVENEQLFDEEINNKHAAVPNQYDSLVHTHTKDRIENVKILEKWRDVVLEATNNEGILSFADELPGDILSIYKENHLLNLPKNHEYRYSIHYIKDVTALDLKNSISKWLNSVDWPALDLRRNQIEEHGLSKEEMDSFIMMTLLLPATPILKYNDTLYNARNFFAVNKKRSDPSFLYGNTTLHLFNNNTVFVYTRHKSGNPGLLVAYSTAKDQTTIDLSNLPNMNEDVTIVGVSANYMKNATEKKIKSNSLMISPRSTIIVDYVPKQ